MSHSRCLRCDDVWDAERVARCPRCLAAFWQSRDGFVTSKHHPHSRSELEPHYHSILTPHFLDHLDEFIAYASSHGRWYFDTYYLRYVHFTPEPLGRAPGVGIPPGQRSPDHALDSMLVADAAGDAHVFAVKRTIVEAQIAAGEFEPIARCAEPSCANLRDPDDRRCALHCGLAEHVSSAAAD